MLRTFQHGIRGSEDEIIEKHDYRLVIDGVTYANDEISDDLKVSVSANTDGFGVGMLPSSTISGTVKFSAEPSRSARIYLYADGGLVGNWFLSEMQITDNKTMSFVGADIISFCDNDYGFIPEYDADGNVVNSTVEVHVDFIQKAIAAASGVSPTIPVINKDTPVDLSTLQNARSVLSQIAASGGMNYRQPFETIEPQFELFIMGDGQASISDSEREEVSYSVKGKKITGVVCYTSDSPYTPTLNQGETLEKYGIYFYGDAAPPTDSHRVVWNTLEICSPFMQKENPNIEPLIGKYFGTSFSCDKVKIQGKFINVCDRITFESIGGGATFYADNITYSFTQSGVFASISGQGRSLSDFEYVGATAQQIAQRPAFGYTYGVTRVTQNSGLEFVYSGKNSDGSPKTENYKFDTKKGGFTSYDGVQSSTKEATKIDVDKNAGTVTVTYKDKSVYKYSATVNESDSSFQITDEKDEWTEPPEGGTS